ncbi:MAG TPA: DUF2752 domain-containing protein [Vicinamibacteria bacterium]|nr:DUF2752 domain-containing protein [Vicinamibacteria bacterium]
MSGESVASPARGGILRAVPGAFPVGALTAAAGGLGGTAVVLLSTYKLSAIVCYFKLFTGYPCLTCGGTRAAMRLLVLDPAGALAMNPLVTVAGLLVAAWGLADLVLLTRRRALRVELGPRAMRVLQVAVPLAVVANWIYLIAVGR